MDQKYNQGNRYYGLRRTLFLKYFWYYAVSIVVINGTQGTMGQYEIFGNFSRHMNLLVNIYIIITL